MGLPPPPPRPPAYRSPGGAPPPPPPGSHPITVNTSGIETNEYDHVRSRWGIGDAVLSMVVFFVVSLAVGLVAITQSDGDGLDGYWLPIAIGVPSLAQLSHVVWIGRARGTGVVADFQLRARFGDVATGAALCVSGLILAGITASVILAVFDEQPSAAAADLALDSEGGNGVTVPIYLFAILAATLIPLVEELVFRGLWWSALEKRGLHPVAVLTITSAVFAIVHLEPIRTPVLFVLGMTIGVGRLVTGRIGPSIAAHMFVNAIGMIFLLIDIS